MEKHGGENVIAQHGVGAIVQIVVRMNNYVITIITHFTTHEAIGIALTALKLNST